MCLIRPVKLLLVYTYSTNVTLHRVLYTSTMLSCRRKKKSKDFFCCVSIFCFTKLMYFYEHITNCHALSIFNWIIYFYEGTRASAIFFLQTFAFFYTVYICTLSRIIHLLTSRSKVKINQVEDYILSDRRERSEKS